MGKIFYHAVPVDWRREQKTDFLEKAGSIAGVKWKELKPDAKHHWLTNKNDAEFDEFLPIGSKEAKAGTSLPVIFKTYSLGVSTNRDDVVYDFDEKRLAKRVEQFADDYNAELHRWQKKGRPKDIDNFVSNERVKWRRDLKLKLTREVEIEFDAAHIRNALYRPFTKLKLYAANPVIDREGPVGFFHTRKKNIDRNTAIALTGPGSERPFFAVGTDIAVDLHLASFGCGSQCFPLFSYSDDGKERHDNITSQAVTRFQNHFDDDSIKRLDIFHYVYALLHHPAYRTRYAENLKRELPRIPLLAAGVVSAPLDGTANTGDERTAKEIKQDAEAFWAFAKAGKRLAELHVNYEEQPEFPLKRIENKEAKLNWRVETMKLTKDHALLIYNDWLSLAGIPEEVFDYRLGNRSALEWVIDQYRVTRDADEEITSDPNRLDDEEYIVRLIGQVVHVSVETLKVIGKLPELKFP